MHFPPLPIVCRYACDHIHHWIGSWDHCVSVQSRFGRCFARFTGKINCTIIAWRFGCLGQCSTWIEVLRYNWTSRLARFKSWTYDSAELLSSIANWRIHQRLCAQSGIVQGQILLWGLFAEIEATHRHQYIGVDSSRFERRIHTIAWHYIGLLVGIVHSKRGRQLNCSKVRRNLIANTKKKFISIDTTDTVRPIYFIWSKSTVLPTKTHFHHIFYAFEASGKNQFDALAETPTRIL